MKKLLVLLILPALFTGCARTSRVCDTDPPNLPIEIRNELDLDPVEFGQGSYELQIGNRLVSVDHIVHGPLCDVNWSGTVYVDCDVEVAPWGEVPNFFDGCEVIIEEGTEVYVAYHNDEVFYRGCSCHFSDSR